MCLSKLYCVISDRREKKRETSKEIASIQLKSQTNIVTFTFVYFWSKQVKCRHHLNSNFNKIWKKRRSTRKITNSLHQKSYKQVEKIIISHNKLKPNTCRYGKKIDVVINFARIKRMFSSSQGEKKIAIDKVRKIIFTMKKKERVNTRKQIKTELTFLSFLTSASFHLFLSAFFISLYFFISWFHWSLST